MYQKKINKNFIKKTLKIIIPIIFAQIIIVSVGFVDNFMIAGYDKNQNSLISVGIGTEIWFSLSSLYLSIGILFNVLYAQFYHSNKKMFQDIFKVNIYVSIFFAIIIYLIMYFFSYELVKLFSWNQDDGMIKQIEKSSISFLKILSFGSIFFGLSYLIINPLLMIGKSHCLLIVSAISLFFNTLFDYIFIYILNIGSNGAAFSTSISYFIQFLISIVLFWKNKNNFENIKNIFNLNKKAINLFLKRIWMVFSIFLFNSSLVIITILWSNMYGIKLIKSLSIGYAISGIMFTIFPAINQSIKIMISKELAKNNFKEALIISKNLFKIIFCITLIISVLGIIISFTIPNLLINDKIAANKTRWIILLYSIGLIFYVTNSYYCGVIESGGNQIAPMILNYLSQFWLIMPFMIILGTWGFNWSFENNIMISESTTIFLSLTSFLIYKKNNWMVNLNK